jgi:hypothetical protein
VVLVNDRRGVGCTNTDDVHTNMAFGDRCTSIVFVIIIVFVVRVVTLVAVVDNDNIVRHLSTKLLC